MLTIEALRAYGANVDEALTRCMNNEAFYLKLVQMALSDTANLDRLRKGLSEDDPEEAFEAVHALKGVWGNLSLDPIFEPASELTELLRAREPGDYTFLLEDIEKGFGELVRIAAE